MTTPSVHVGELARNDRGAFKIGPFGSSLKKSELVPSGIPVAGIENVLPNEFIKGFRRFVTPKKFEELSDYEIQPGDVLVTTMGTIGRAAVAPLDIGRTIIDSHLFRMRVDTNRVYPRFLCYAINSELVLSQLKRMARGAIMEGLNTGILKECLIPLPRLPEQNRIVTMLQEADRLRRARRYARQLSDTFLQSVFLQMFGAPLKHQMDWDIEELSSLCEKIAYGVTASATSSPIGPKFLRITDIQDGMVNWQEVPYCQVAEEERNAASLKSGDIVFARTGATTGKSFLIESCPANSVFASYLIRVRPTSRVNSVYLYGFFQSQSYWQQISRTVVGSTQPGVNASKLGELKTPVPPLPLQQKFAAIVHPFERLRAQQREAERQAEHLFQTLLHRAFSSTV